MADNVEIGQNATLGYKISPASVYTVLGHIKTLSAPDAVYGSTDISGLPSQFTTKRATVIDPGEMSFSVFANYQNATFAAMKTLLLTPGQPSFTTSWQITFPEGTTSTFFGFLTSFKEDELVYDQPVEAEGSVMLTSIPVYVAGSGG